MGMLAEDVDHVIGVDTHRDAHAAAIVAITGVVVAQRGGQASNEASGAATRPTPAIAN